MRKFGKRLSRVGPVRDTSEHAEQKRLFELVALDVGRWPELALLFAIPNAGAGAQKGQAGKMKAEGVKPGVPDLCLPVARGGYHGLFIELKTRLIGSLSPIQRHWLTALKEQGYYATSANGYDIALAILHYYIQQPKTIVLPNA